MEATILHSGFDGLKCTIQADISEDLREELASTKQHAKETYTDCILEYGSLSLNVTNKGARGFAAHTGDHGAVWLFHDPQDRIPNNPGITVEFRAFGLATGGLEGAEQHFRECLEAFGIKYVETQLRVARADFAVDFLSPWFEPDREALVVPPAAFSRSVVRPFGIHGLQVIFEVYAPQIINRVYDLQIILTLYDAKIIMI